MRWRAGTLLLLAVMGFLALNWLGTASTAPSPGCDSSYVHGTAFMWTTSSTVSAGWPLMAGLALSGYTHPYVAIGLLVGLSAAFHPVLPGHVHAGRISAFVLELWADQSCASCWQWGTWHFYIAPSSFTDGTGCLMWAASSGFGMSVMLICFTARNTVAST